MCIEGIALARSEGVKSTDKINTTLPEIWSY
jgi:hypothetical protein